MRSRVSSERITTNARTEFEIRTPEGEVALHIGTDEPVVMRQPAFPRFVARFDYGMQVGPIADRMAGVLEEVLRDLLWEADSEPIRGLLEEYRALKAKMAEVHPA